MNTIIIQRSSRPGADPQIFRGYQEIAPGKLKSLGVNCSTTGNEKYAIIRCAAKAFIKVQEPGGDLDEVETRIKVEPLGLSPESWAATLQPKG
jgi:hypothetical protein